MALDATNVRAGTTGAVYVAPEGSTLPTDASTALDAAFLDTGYISEDGVTESQDSSTSDIKAWQNAAVVRKIQDSHDLTYQFTMIETNDVSLETYYGPLNGTTVEIKGEELPHQAFVLSVIDGDHTLRAVIPDGQVTERGEVVYQNGDVTGRPVTVTCYPDVSGVKAYVYRAEA